MLGQISLNLSFLMYMFLYLPQLIHNQKQTNLAELSKWMHLTLYLGYSLDLVYGFGNNLPWQYRTVSAIGWVLLTIQHFQLIYHFKQTEQKFFQISFYGILLFSTALLILLSINPKPFVHLALYILGYAAQIAFVIAFIPQILKSKRLQSAQALNIFYILLCLLLAILDCISAWQLNWGWPNKLGSCLIILLTSMLLMQYYRYQFSKRTRCDQRLLPS
jgi:uncharacterized protein with PQ loop repeat